MQQQAYSGPYIITVTTPEMASTVESGQPWPRTTSRRAVATLEEARSLADREWAPGSDLNEDGGLLGPLDDGTMVEVKRVGWGVLREALTAPSGLRPHDSNLGAQIIAAYNRKQKSEC